MYAYEKEKNTLKKHPAITQKTVQRKVGMEFQCMGSKDVVDEKYEGCNHGVILRSEKDGFKITGDMGNFEFVTNAEDERTGSGILTLMENCENAANAFENIIGILSPNKVKKGDYYKIENDEGNAKNLYIKKGATTAHPQATVGIKFKNVDLFLDKYVQAFKTPLKERKPEWEVTDICGMREDELYLPFGGSRNELKLKNAQMNIVEKSKCLAPKSTVVSIDPLSEEAKGLIRLLNIMCKSYTSYVANVKVPPINAKSALPIMPRTSLEDAYMLLNIEEQTLFKNSNPEILKRIASSTSTNFVLAGNKGEKVTYEDWADSLPAPAISFKGWKGVKEEPLKKIDSGIGGISNREIKTSKEKKDTAFGVERSTQIYDSKEGDKSNEVEGIIMELRGLERKVAPKNWKFVARDVAKLVYYANLNPN